MVDPNGADTSWVVGSGVGLFMEITGSHENALEGGMPPNPFSTLVTPPLTERENTIHNHIPTNLLTLATTPDQHDVSSILFPDPVTRPSA